MPVHVSIKWEDNLLQLFISCSVAQELKYPRMWLKEDWFSCSSQEQEFTR